MPDRTSADGRILARWRREARRAIPRADPDLIEEVAQHVAERWRAAVDEGVSEAAADDRARRDLDAWKLVPVPSRAPGWRWSALWTGSSTDARSAVRSLRVRPVFTVGAVLLSAIAILSNVAAFAIAYGILWRPLPYPDSDRLAVIWQVRDGEAGQVSFPDYADLKQTNVFDEAVALAGGRGSLRVGEGIERVNLLEMEARGYALLGATPVAGRMLSDADAGQPLLMISERLWRTHLNADPHVIGRMLWLSGRDHTVVGVLPASFDFELPVPPAFRLEKHDLWRVLDRSGPFVSLRDVSTYEVLVRLAPSTTLTEAQAALDAIGQRLAREHAATNRDRTFRIVPLKDEVVGSVRRPLALALLAGAIALLVALANLVTLAMIRLSEREVELAVRQALGAGRLRLRRQLLAENALLACAGAAIGVPASIHFTRLLAASETLHLPRPDAIRFDGPVQLFALGLTVLIAVALTVLPLGMHRAMTILRTGGRTAGGSMRRARRLAVAAELALAIALAAGGALLGLSLFRLLGTDPGFSTSGVAAVRVSAYEARYPTAGHVRTFFSEVIRKLTEAPGVSRAAAGSSLPLSGQSSGTSVQAEGQPVLPGSRLSAGWQFVTPGYFAAIGMPVTAGRDFTDADQAHAGHVTVINRELARALFGDTDPIGRRIAVGGGDDTGDWHEVIGVVGDVRHHALDRPAAPRVYDLFGEHWGRTLYVVVRSPVADAAVILPTVRRAIRSIDPEAPVFESATTATLLARAAATRRVAAALAVSLAAAAVLLALIGVYAAAAASVAERTRELGIRAALGAAPGDLLRFVLLSSALTAACGGLVGLAGALVVARLLEAHLFGVRTSDVLLLIPSVGCALVIVGLAAALPAALRAAHLDPLGALRAE